MLKINIHTEGVELESYSEDCRVVEYIHELDKVYKENSLCQRCGKCCFDMIPITGYEVKRIMAEKNVTASSLECDDFTFPNPPDIEAKENSIRDFIHTFKVSPQIAAIFYEYNNAEPIVLNKNQAGQCLSIVDNQCGKYDSRPLVCRLYHCKLGKKAASINDMIMNQGIWHSYYTMGWLAAKDIPYNPFLKGHGYEDLFLKDFDQEMDEVLEKFDI